MYSSPQELKKLIKDHRKTGVVSPELTDLIFKIATGLYGRYHFVCDIEDYKQECWVVIVSNLHNVRLNGNPFNYLTTIAFNVFRAMNRKTAAQERIIEHLKKHHPPL